MGLRWLINASLLALPVGTMLGVLIGTDAYRRADGQKPLFSGNSGSTGGNGIGGDISVNGVRNSQYCELQVAVSPASKGTEYTLNPNQWGVTEGEAGSMCMNITTFDNTTYSTLDTSPSFFVTWQYPKGPDTQPTHAFPNAQLKGDLPLALADLQHINLDLAWTYGLGSSPVASTDTSALTLNNVTANVAVDMFFDADKDNSQNSSKAAYEVMVWFAAFGVGTEPIGLETGVVATEIVNGTSFNLYTGKNSLLQKVSTWVAANTTESFSGNITPLVTRLSSISNGSWGDFPAAQLYLGHLGFGSEAFWSPINVTFSVPLLAMDVGA